MTKHSAPAVVYPIGQSPFQFWFSWGVWLVGLLVVMLWFLSTLRVDWRMGVGGTAVLFSGWALQYGWRNAINSGELAWDGGCWRWANFKNQSISGELALSVVVDFQKILVLVLDDSRGSRLWLCAENSAFPQRWMDFRRAVYSDRKAVDDKAAGEHVAG